MTDWSWTIEEAPAESTPSRSESFAALDAESRAPERSVGVSATNGCPKDYLDVIVRDPDGKPLAGIDCKLAFPEGGDREEKTGSDGRAHFDGVKADPNKLKVRVYDTTAEGAETRTWRAEVVPLAEDAPAQADESAGAPQPFYYVEIDTTALL